MIKRHFFLSFLLAASLFSASAQVSVNNPVANSSKASSLPVWALGSFIRPAGDTPILKSNPALSFYCPMHKSQVRWAESDVFNPAAVVKDGKIVVLFRSEDNSATGIGMRTSRIGMAVSADGIRMHVSKEPVMYPAEDAAKEFEWPGGCEDPRVAVSEDGLYVMLYTMWNRKVPRLGVATSRDLLHWQKHGPAFAKAYNGRFLNLECKSGSVVTQLKEGKQVIAKVNGKYLMYWGEHAVCAATSDDLINWTPVLGRDNEMLSLIEPREGFFDSDLTECGPPSIITPNGILLIYNGKNRSDYKRDTHFTAGTYSAGQVLFDLNNPFKPIGRLDTPFFKPEASFEKSGQYTDGTVFMEGLVYFRNQWFLYYGCADSKVGVAVYNPGQNLN